METFPVHDSFFCPAMWSSLLRGGPAAGHKIGDGRWSGQKSCSIRLGGGISRQVIDKLGLGENGVWSEIPGKVGPFIVLYWYPKFKESARDIAPSIM